jgi:hypothetical protein
VIFKNIARDMRKFFKKEFNASTNFIYRKRSVGKNVFMKHLLKFLDSCYPELNSLIPPSKKNPGLMNSPLDPEDLLYFMGILLYPKELWIYQNLQTQEE